jgi:hypothetical protein
LTDGQLTVFSDANSHLIERARSIRFAKCFPGKTDGESEEFCEEAAADDEIPGSVKLEEEWFSLLKNFERKLRRRLPEVDLLNCQL